MLMLLLLDCLHEKNFRLLSLGENTFLYPCMVVGDIDGGNVRLLINCQLRPCYCFPQSFLIPNGFHRPWWYRHGPCWIIERNHENKKESGAG